MGNDGLHKTAAEIGRGIAAGTIDPVALARSFLDAAASHPQGGRIYARLTADRALAEAAAARDRARAGLRRGPLDGVPVSWKDLFDTAGIATEAGSALLAGRVPAADAAVLAQATGQGLVCLGKTHMSELAFSGLGLNPVTATPPCINDPAAVPGGSSSGAAASVAFGLAPAAIGSDTGGSVRVPAAWNDLVGLKTTAGRLPLTGVVPLADSFDTVGPLTRSVEDATLLLAALAGTRPADLGHAHAGGASLRGVRLMVLDTVAADDLRPAPAAALQSALTRLSRAGATIVHGTAPEAAEALSLAGPLVVAEAWGIWRPAITAAPEKMFRRIRERFEGGGAFSGADVVAAWRRLRVLRAEWQARIAGFDAVVLATSAILPPDAQRLMDDDAYYVTENLLALRNTRIANLLDGCALTLPTGTPSCGVMFWAAPGADERLLRLGAAAERALAVA